MEGRCWKQWLAMDPSIFVFRDAVFNFSFGMATPTNNTPLLREQHVRVSPPLLDGSMHH